MAATASTPGVLRAAKAAWYPVLRGTRPWHLINEAPSQAGPVS